MLRTSDEIYHQAWLPWATKIGQILSASQITNGGVGNGLKSLGKLMLTNFQPVILNQVENELQETVHSPTNTLILYMKQLEAAYRASGIEVPFTHNEKGQCSQSWSTDYGNAGGGEYVRP